MRKIEIYWLDERNLDGHDNGGWVYRITGDDTGGGAIGQPETLGPDSSVEEVIATLAQQLRVARDQAILGMLAQHRSLTEISDIMRLSERQISRIAQRYGQGRGRGRPAKQTTTDT